MLAPPQPGKRKEQLRFNLDLLFTDKHVEYCIQEARVRSMGLLGKKWAPLPITNQQPSASSSKVQFSVADSPDDNQRNTTRRNYIGGGNEPTVTIARYSPRSRTAIGPTTSPATAATTPAAGSQIHIGRP